MSTLLTPSRVAENHIRLHSYGDGWGVSVCNGQHVPMLLLL